MEREKDWEINLNSFEGLPNGARALLGRRRKQPVVEVSAEPSKKTTDEGQTEIEGLKEFVSQLIPIVQNRAPAVSIETVTAGLAVFGINPALHNPKSGESTLLKIGERIIGVPASGVENLGSGFSNKGGGVKTDKIGKRGAGSMLDSCRNYAIKLMNEHNNGGNDLLEHMAKNGDDEAKRILFEIELDLGAGPS